MSKEKLKPGDFAYIEWNGSMYNKKQHYHVLEVLRSEVHVRVPGSYIKKIIKKSDIKDYEVLELKQSNDADK